MRQQLPALPGHVQLIFREAEQGNGVRAYCEWRKGNCDCAPFSISVKSVCWQGCCLWISLRFAKPSARRRSRRRAALWARAGTDVARGLVGEARLVTEFLRQLPAPRTPADALLTGAGPSELCGAEATADEAHACLSALHSTATGKVWREWVRRWSDDSVLASFTQNRPAWWQRWIPK